MAGCAMTASEINRFGLDLLDVSRPEIYRDDAWREPFRYLRQHAPINRVDRSDFGPYWSVSTYAPIVEIESNPLLFSSELGSFSIAPVEPLERRTPMFIGRDPPVHTAQRRTVAPAFTSAAVQRLQEDVRRRTGALLDALPRKEKLDWAARVSTELTSQMLAVLFDFPWEERAKLSEWSDWMGDVELMKDPKLQNLRFEKVREAGMYFQALWNERSDAPPTGDLLSMMIHSDAMGRMDFNEFMGNLSLLIVAGSDTTRNTMTGLAYALDQYPSERAKLHLDRRLIPNAVNEAIRWQTPVAHMARTAVAETSVLGQQIAAGDKLVLWYISANRDELVFGEDADLFRVDRANARKHLSYGHGIHRCVGARLAELQLTILLEEMTVRNLRVNVVEEPTHVAGCFIHGYRQMQVELD